MAQSDQPSEKNKEDSLLMSNLKFLGNIFLPALQAPGTSYALDAGKYFDDPQVVALVNDIQRGRADKVKAALERGVDPNALGKVNIRPIFFIFPASNTDAARVLLEAGADPNVRLENGEPVLMYAVVQKNSGFTKLLLEHGADPNAIGDNDKPVMHQAIRSGFPEQVQLLASAGGDINVVWGAGTPLTAAIAGLSWAMATTLLDLGADTEWRKEKGKVRTTAGEKLCNFFTRERPLKIPRELHGDVRELFMAFERRGVKLSCTVEDATR